MFHAGIPIEALSDSYHINKGVIEKIVNGSYKPPAPKGSIKRKESIDLSSIMNKIYDSFNTRIKTKKEEVERAAEELLILESNPDYVAAKEYLNRKTKREGTI